MKPTKQFAYCENCDEPISIPPEKSHFENGQVHIEVGTVLLPHKIAKLHADKTNSRILVHHRSIDGYYCTTKCLQHYLAELLHG